MKSRYMYQNSNPAPNNTYNIIPCYCADDHAFIDPVLEYFQRRRCSIHDPGLIIRKTPQSKTDDDMQQTKFTVLFITKHFLNDTKCQLMMNLEIMKYIETNGNHLVIPIIMENCTVPLILKLFKCIYVWKRTLPWQHRQQCRLSKVCICNRILKDISGPKPNFQRIKIYVLKKQSNIKHRIDKSKEFVLRDLQQSKKRLHFKTSELGQLSNNLDRCFLRCRSAQCSFVCRGENFRLFIKHAQICKYQLVSCPNKGCLLSPPKCSLSKQLIENCPIPTVICTFPNCGKRVLRKTLDKHQRKCPYRQFACPNKILGCQEYANLYDITEHNKMCKFKAIEWKYCGNTVTATDRNTHLNECEKNRIACNHCGKIISKKEQDCHEKIWLNTIVACPNSGCELKMPGYHFLQHTNYCQYKVVDCPYNECLFRDINMHINTHAEHCQFKPVHCAVCGLGMLTKDFGMHANECNSFVECARCRKMIRRSSMRTHDKFICSRRNYKYVCTICHQLYDPCDFEVHKNHDIASIRSSTDEQNNRILTSPACVLPTENKEQEFKERKANLTDQEEITYNQSELKETIEILNIHREFTIGNGVDECWEEEKSREMWYGGRYAKGRKKFERILAAIERNRCHIYTSSIKEAYNFGCKKYDRDFTFVEQFR